MAINLAELKKTFEKHIDSITREELLESARRVAEMTAGCDDDWPDDLVQVVRCKDCIRAMPYKRSPDAEYILRCQLWGFATTEPDAFCSYGRKNSFD